MDVSLRSLKQHWCIHAYTIYRPVLVERMGGGTVVDVCEVGGKVEA